jgi:hypothetical protein
MKEERMAAQMTNEQKYMAEEAGRMIAIDQPVYDTHGDEVGTVAAFDRGTGWMTVEHGMLVSKDLYVPFSAIASANGQEIFLSLTRDDLEWSYGTPPAHSTIVETMPDPAAPTLAVTSEPSGYDGRPVVIARANVDEMGRRIAAGVDTSARDGDSMHVYAVDGKKVGKITRYDATPGSMLVERGVLFEHRTFYIPITVVDGVNLEANEVYLAVPEADLHQYIVP